MPTVVPAQSLLLGGIAWTGTRTAGGLPSELLRLFAQVNLAIGLFNLLPAFPLDGGRILRGALSRPLGPVRATRVASVTGRVVAVALGVVGVLAGAVLLTLIAVFVFVGATTESRAEYIEA